MRFLDILSNDPFIRFQRVVQRLSALGNKVRSAYNGGEFTFVKKYLGQIQTLLDNSLGKNTLVQLLLEEEKLVNVLRPSKEKTAAAENLTKAREAVVALVSVVQAIIDQSNSSANYVNIQHFILDLNKLIETLRLIAQVEEELFLKAKSLPTLISSSTQKPLAYSHNHEGINHFLIKGGPKQILYIYYCWVKIDYYQTKFEEEERQKIEKVGTPVQRVIKLRYGGEALVHKQIPLEPLNDHDLDLIMNTRGDTFDTIMKWSKVTDIEPCMLVNKIKCLHAWDGKNFKQLETALDLMNHAMDHQLTFEVNKMPVSIQTKKEFEHYFKSDCKHLPHFSYFMEQVDPSKELILYSYFSNKPSSTKRSVGWSLRKTIEFLKIPRYSPLISLK